MNKYKSPLALLLGTALLFNVNARAAEAVFNVRDLGAKGDGKTLDTEAIQKAFDSVKNGGTIVFPAGNYVSAPGPAVNPFDISAPAG